MMDAINWTDGNDRPRGIEIGVVFSAFLQQESVDFRHHFLKSHFFRPTQAKTVVFRGQFLVGRVGSGRLLAKMWKNGRTMRAGSPHKNINLLNFKMV